MSLHKLHIDMDNYLCSKDWHIKYFQQIFYFDKIFTSSNRQTIIILSFSLLTKLMFIHHASRQETDNKKREKEREIKRREIEREKHTLPLPVFALENIDPFHDEN